MPLLSANMAPCFTSIVLVSPARGFRCSQQSDLLRGIVAMHLPITWQELKSTSPSDYALGKRGSADSATC
jgi:hypothetical protein